MHRFAIAAALLAATPALAAVETSVTLSLGGSAEKHVVIYDCEGADAPLSVTYLNAQPNFLAVIPIAGEDIVFANVISASGAKYESGSYVWWNKGSDATLHDVSEGLDAAPVLTCTENVQTP